MSSMNFTFIGRVKIFSFTSVLRSSILVSLVASFSVVMIIFGSGMTANVSLMRSMSLRLKL